MKSRLSFLCFCDFALVTQQFCRSIWMQSSWMHSRQPFLTCPFSPRYVPVWVGYMYANSCVVVISLWQSMYRAFVLYWNTIFSPMIHWLVGSRATEALPPLCTFDIWKKRNTRTGVRVFSWTQHFNNAFVICMLVKSVEYTEM